MPSDGSAHRDEAVKKRGARIKHLAVLPGRARDSVSLETSHYMALQLLGTAEFGRDQAASIGAAAYMVREIPRSRIGEVAHRHAEAVIRTLNEVMDLAERTGSIEVSAAREAALRASCPIVFRALEGARNSDIARASLAVLAMQRRVRNDNSGIEQ